MDLYTLHTTRSPIGWKEVKGWGSEGGEGCLMMVVGGFGGGP